MTALMIALRYVRSKGSGFVSLMSIFSFVGIALGVATLIIVLSVMSGFREKLLSKILEFNCHVSVLSRTPPLKDYEILLEKAKRLPNVVSAVSTIEDQALLLKEDKASGVKVKAMSLEDLEKNLGPKIVFGSLELFSTQEDVLVLGQRLAERLGVHVGDRLSLMVQKGNFTPFGYAPRQKTFRVAATFDVGMFEYNIGFVFIPFATAQRLFRMENGVSEIEINFVSAHNVRQEVQKLIKTFMRPDLFFLDWQKRHSGFLDTIAVERNVMFIILTLIILIASFNIISGLMMLIKDKTRAIGLLRAIGLTRGQSVGIFMLVGSVIGVGGTLLGTIVGIVFCLNIEKVRSILEKWTNTSLFSDEIYYLSKLPAVLNMNEVILVVTIALGLSFLSTLYPSLRAARLNPVEALRYDG